MSRDTGPKATDIIQELAASPHSFPYWEAGSPEERGFGVAELAQRLAELGEALALVHGAFVATGAVVDYLHRFYRWARGIDPEAVPEASDRERILVLLFDAYAGSRGALTAEHVATRVGVDAAATRTHLAALRDMHLVKELADGRWRYRVR
jgi:DNA-binding transcriptional ArsR family regulator